MLSTLFAYVDLNIMYVEILYHGVYRGSVNDSSIYTYILCIYMTRYICRGNEGVIVFGRE